MFAGVQYNIRYRIMLLEAYLCFYLIILVNLIFFFSLAFLLCFLLLQSCFILIFLVLIYSRVNNEKPLLSKINVFSLRTKHIRKDETAVYALE